MLLEHPEPNCFGPKWQWVRCSVCQAVHDVRLGIEHRDKFWHMRPDVCVNVLWDRRCSRIQRCQQTTCEDNVIPSKIKILHILLKPNRSSRGVSRDRAHVRVLTNKQKKIVFTQEQEQEQEQTSNTLRALGASPRRALYQNSTSQSQGTCACSKQTTNLFTQDSNTRRRTRGFGKI